MSMHIAHTKKRHRIGERSDSFTEKFRMRTKASQKDVLGFRVFPYQQEISLDMAFQITGPIAGQRMRTAAG